MTWIIYYHGKNTDDKFHLTEPIPEIIDEAIEKAEASKTKEDGVRK